MNKQPNICNMMTPFPYTIDIDATISEAQATMEDHRIHHLPVKEDGQLVGVLSSRDITLMLSLLDESMNGDELKVRKAYTPAPFAVDINSEPAEALDQMIKRQIGSTIVTKNGMIAGIITHTDICKALKEMIEGPQSGDNDSPSAA